jgi:hypothetical protein
VLYPLASESASYVPGQGADGGLGDVGDAHGSGIGSR